LDVHVVADALQSTGNWNGKDRSAESADDPTDAEEFAEGRLVDTLQHVAKPGSVRHRPCKSDGGRYFMGPVPISFQRILCPTDFSLYSIRAFRHATTLARLFRAELTVLHVIPTFAPYGVESPLYSMPSWTSPGLTREAEGEMARFVQSASEAGVSLKTRIVEGHPANEIQALAAALPADLIVVGTHGQGGFERFVLGSVAEKVIRSAPCAVLAVGKVSPEPGNRGGFRRIVCALDLTEASAHTMNVALALGAECEATITLLHILEGFSLPWGPHFPVALPDLAPLHREVREQALAALRKAVPDDAALRGAVDFRVESGSPWREIVRIAALTKADLVVVGAHARGRGGNSFLGSTSSQVVRHAGCPVLVLREGT
jgi:nucleotide-binding universal stress UspA family protein